MATEIGSYQCMVAITVSTNYSDLLPIVYSNNKAFFKHWVFVTAKEDSATIKFLSDKPEVTILYWDFQNQMRVFDKGGAICHAQAYTYEKFPDDWYLLLDSDICLPPIFSRFLNEAISQLNVEAIYGLNDRMDFETMSDFLSFKNYKLHKHKNHLYGYFQLYRKKFFYSSSRNASRCDAEFVEYFSKIILIHNVPCAHLGGLSHWNGNRRLGSDFNLG